MVDIDCITMFRKRCHSPVTESERTFFSSGLTIPFPRKKRTRHDGTAVVRFADASQNEYFEPILSINENDDDNNNNNCIKSLVWYSKPELKAMEATAARDARQLKTQEKYTPATEFSWSRSLYRVFRALKQQQQENSIEDEDDDVRQQQIILNHRHTVVLTARVMGLEGVIVSPISRDFITRRKQILAYLQQRMEVRKQHLIMSAQPSEPPVKDRDWDESLANAVRRESRVARLYAQVLAQASLNATED